MSSIVLMLLGDSARDSGDVVAARALYEESVRTFRDLGDRVGRARALAGLAGLARAQGDTATARALLEESLSIQNALGDRPNAWWSLRLLGEIAAERGEYAVACSRYAEALLLAREMGDQVSSAAALLRLASLAAAEAHAERAVRLAGAAAALRETSGLPVPGSDQSEQERQVEQARRALGEAAATAAWAEGQTMTLEEAVAYALEGTPPAQRTPAHPG
jgi:non-specific serine/threonine protein kinase